MKNVQQVDFLSQWIRNEWENLLRELRREKFCITAMNKKKRKLIALRNLEIVELKLVKMCEREKNSLMHRRANKDSWQIAFNQWADASVVSFSGSDLIECTVNGFHHHSERDFLFNERLFIDRLWAK